MVLKITCPTVRLPTEASNKKRPRGDMGWNDDALSYSSSSSKSNRQSDGVYQKREEISSIFSSVKDFSSSSFLGLKKKQHKEDKLTKLGAQGVKQQKMPFKQRIGLDCARKKRDIKNEQKAKEEGVVLAKVSKKNRNDRSRRESSTNDHSSPGRASSASRARSESSSFGINTKSGVMHLSKKRLPGKLMRHNK
jgi:Domain of unknown function (DUF4602)